MQPKCTWRPPAQLPKFQEVIAVDLETCDPDLKKYGPSYKRGQGKVVGVAIADLNESERQLVNDLLDRTLGKNPK